MKKTVLFFLLAGLTALAGCKSHPQTPTPTITAAETAIPTQRSTPVTPTPTQSAVPTPTPTLTPSVVVSATHTLPPPTKAPTRTPTPTPSGHLGVTQQGGKLGQTWNLATMRYGLHSNYLRVVWEMAEAGKHVPFFEVVEVDNAADPFPTGHDASWGAARIDLVVSDLYAYDFPLGNRLPIVPPDNPRVTRIGLYPTYSDSQLGFSIGLKAPSAYKVYELTNPVRIVIDVFYSE
jgi:hypothetical protein